MPPGVLFVARWYPSFDDPGRGIFVADQAAALRAAGVDVVVASFEFVRYRGSTPGADGRQDRDRPDGHSPMAVWAEAVATDPWLAEPPSWGAKGIPVARLPAAAPNKGSGPRDPLELASAEAETLIAFGTALAKRWQIDLIHAHTGLPDGSAAAQLADRLNVPLLVTEHESGLAARLATEPARDAYRALFGPRRRVVAVSRVLASQIAHLLGPTTPAVEVIPNAVDVTAFRLAGPDERDANELLWVGSRQASKGTDELLRAFRILHDARPALRLRLIGRAAGDEDTRLWVLARSLGIDAAVSFEPAGDRATVADAMTRAGVFVHPSPRETFGVVAVEAMASGLPVAAAPSGGVDEILGTDGRFGEIAESPAAPDLAAAVERVLDRRLDFDPAALRAHAQEHYAAHAVATQILDAYRSLLGPVAPASPAPAPDAAADRVDAADGGRPASSSTAAAGDLPVLVGLRRETVVAQLAAIPPELAASLRVVTSAPASSAAPAEVTEVADLSEVDTEAAFRAAVRALGGPPVTRSKARRLVSAALHPVWAVRVWRLAGRRAASRLDAQRAAVAMAIETAVRADRVGQPIRLLPLDVDDIPIIQPLLTKGVRLYPTTVRGLVDRWDEAGRPKAAPRPIAPIADAARPPAGAAQPPATDAPAYDPAAYWSALHDRNDLSAVSQSALPPEINAWLHRVLAGNLTRFLRRNGIRRPGPSSAFDVGIGSGYWVRFWRTLGVRTVDGCDLVPDAVDRVRAQAEAAGAGGTYLAADIGVAGALPDTTYPLVSCMNVLLHVVDDGAFDIALHNIAGLVAPGGSLILAEPILSDPAYEVPFDPRRHSRARALGRYQGPLEAAGLELIEVRAAVVLANNAIEAGSAASFGRYKAWWRFLARRSKANAGSARWLGPLVFGLDRIAMTGGAAPSTKFALFRRPPATKGG